MNSVLLVTEGDARRIYNLNEKKEWERGRPHENNRPDIELSDRSVSRRQGRLQNIDGVWFYLDNNKGNGSIHNGKRIDAGLKGRIRPILLEDGDILEFGCRKNGEDVVTVAKAKYVADWTEGQKS